MTAYYGKKMPTAIVVFGIMGDLARRMLVPALYHLYRGKLLSDQTVIIGITRR